MGESKLFHAIVVVGLSFGSSACGSTGRDDGTGGRATADAESEPTSPDAAPDVVDSGVVIGLGMGTTQPDGATEVTCPPDSGGPDAGHCIWPVYI